MVTLSVVVPVFNEEAVLPLFAKRLRTVVAGIDPRELGDGYEVLVVDDGSTDASPVVLAGLRRDWPELRVVRLRRNSGHQAALAAGLHRAGGAYVVSIDADLQDPPEVIPDMLRLARADTLDIVYGVRSDRRTDSAFKRLTAGLYYRLMRRLVGNRVPSHAGDFRLLSRASVQALRELPERRPVYRLLVPWLGFPSGEVTYVRDRRAAGKTKYPLGKMLRLAGDSITTFSAAPLRLATWLGGLGVVACVGLAIYVLAGYLSGNVVSGWTSLFVALVFLGAVQLLCLGLLGEYVGRLYSAVQGRPAYFVAYDSADPGDSADPSDSATDVRGRPVGAAR